MPVSNLKKGDISGELEKAKTFEQNRDIEAFHVYLDFGWHLWPPVLMANVLVLVSPSEYYSHLI